MKTKIQPGKVYRTRNGCIAFIITVCAPGMRPVSATVHGENDPPHTRDYTEFGFEHQPTAGEPEQQLLPYDLVEEINP